MRTIVKVKFHWIDLFLLAIMFLLTLGTGSKICLIIFGIILFISIFNPAQYITKNNERN
jgi:hypothetical protein